MKSALTGFFVFLLFFVVSCKKDKDAGLEKISGDYIVYLSVFEDPDDGPLESPVPAANGDHSKAVVKANKDSTMTVKIYYFNKQNDTLNEVSLTGRAITIGNSLRFVNGNTWLGTFLEDAEVELYPDARTTLYARK